MKRILILILVVSDCGHKKPADPHADANGNVIYGNIHDNVFSGGGSGFHGYGIRADQMTKKKATGSK